MKLRLLVTGGSGFIGTSLINHILIHKKYSVLNIDNLTYASNPIANDLFNNFHNYKFIHGNICNQKLIKNVLNEFKPNIRPVKSSYFKLAASRPHYSKLDTSKIEDYLSCTPSNWSFRVIEIIKSLNF